MKEIILYYSFTGNTKKYVEKVSKEKNIDIYEMTEIKKTKRPKRLYLRLLSVLI